VANVSDSTSSSCISPVPFSNSFRPRPTTTGWIISRSSSSRPWSSSERTSVALPVTEMSFPGCSFSRMISPARSAPRSVEFCQSTSSSIVETTYLGVSFMTCVNGSSGDWAGQKAANSS